MSATREGLQSWLERVSGPDWVWYAKFIAANDTAAKPNVHQAGPYLSKELLRLAFPALSARADRDDNPDLTIPVNIGSHELLQDIPSGESTAEVAARVHAARKLQLARSSCLNARWPTLSGSSST